MAHQCKAIMIHCMDFRLVGETRRWMEQSGYLGNCDVVSMAGASKELLDGGQPARELILKQIGLSINLHQATEVILLHHSDCGAYKASYTFESGSEEKLKQIEDMNRSESIIKERFNDISVRKVWAQMQDEHGRSVSFEFL